MNELTPERLKKLEMRETMLLKRRQLSESDMRKAMIKVSEEVMDIINTKPRIKCVGLYNAINKEIDMTFLAEMLATKGIKVALPRVKVKHEPLVFNTWNLLNLVDKDAEGIPCAMGTEIIPDVVVIPLVAYNKNGYRVGYGSGYYDRTLSTSLKGCFAIGVGYSFQESDSVEEESHDVPMNVIVTEKEILTL
tara:strand:- start:16316 stop:16891 length:576 start_codon:yes stop_codon:yes gene_type:complete